MSALIPALIQLVLRGRRGGGGGGGGGGGYGGGGYGRAPRPREDPAEKAAERELAGALDTGGFGRDSDDGLDALIQATQENIGRLRSQIGGGK